ncbi:MAG: hypothetical protein GF398_21830 [Chitinivibrionales bacterium]|nr:hypothetical protein [Chitinivibrionales bacterium]
MNQHEFFNKAILFLNKTGIRYMVTGSVGAMLYGKPRFTNDMDIIVDLYPVNICHIQDEFSSDDYYVPDREVIENDIQCHGQFNVIHIESGSKIDFIILKEDEFSLEEFLRRQSTPFAEDMDAQTASPEDIILSKLQFYKAGKSDKHISDIKGIIAVMGEELDIAYIASWAKKLSLEDIWRRCRR